MKIASAIKEFTRRRTSVSTIQSAVSSPALLACNVYISEGRDQARLTSVLDSARGVPSTRILRVFRDEHYNRTGITVVGEPAALEATMLALLSSALYVLDLSQQSGLHPRIGAVDHVSVHPVGEATLANAAATVQKVGLEIATSAQVPVYLYGAASPAGRPLDEIRRALGYFKGDVKGQWRGSDVSSSFTTFKPDYGPSTSEKSGCITMGAVPWVVNYNLVVNTQDLAKGKQIARAVSARGGGLSGVQSMALLHSSEGVEIACNIIDYKVTSPETLIHKVQELCRLHELELVDAYFPGLTPETALEMWNTQPCDNP